MELFKYYTVKLKIRDRLIGGYPKNPDTEEAMLKARGLEDLIPPRPDLETLSDEEKKELKENAVEKSWTGFKRNGKGIYIESRHIKAMFKEGANVLKAMIGVKNMKSKLAERVFIEPQEICLGKQDPDGFDTRVVHVMTIKGPRSSIKTFDYVERPEICFDLKLLNDSVITMEHLKTILEYAQDNGLGADRSQDAGKFDLVGFKAKDID